MADKPSQEQQDKALKFVLEKASQWDTMSQHFRNKWLRFYEMYRCFETKGKQPWQAKLFIPKAFEVVEKIVPRLTANNPKFIAIPKKPDANKFTSILQDYLQFVWEEENIKKKVRLWAKSMLIYGTAFVKIDWKLRTKTSKKTEDVEFEGEIFEGEVEEQTLVDEIPTLEVVDIFDILVDPRETDLQEGLGVIHKRDNLLINDLDPDVYFNLDQVKQNQRQIDDDKVNKQSQRGVADQANDGYLNVKEYWGLFPEMDSSGKIETWKEKVIAIADDSVLIRFEDNPFISEDKERGVRPFVAIHDQPVPNEFYGIGEIESIQSLQSEINTLRNQRMDNVNLGINQLWRVDPDAGINPSQVISRPGQLIFARQGEIEPMFNRDVPISSYNEESAINRDIQTTTGTIDFTQDSGSQGFTNTATGERIRSNEANSRYQYKLENVEMGIAEVGNMMIHLASVFADENIVIRRLNEDGDVQFFDINESVFQSAVEGIDVRVDSGSTGFDTVEDMRNNAIALGNISLQYANAGVPVNLVKNFTEIIRHFPNVKNPSAHLQQQVGTEGQIEQQGGQLPQPQNQNPIAEIPAVNQNV